MEKSWMQLRGRYLPEYVKGIEDFIEYARAFADGMDRIRCPCTKCKNTSYMHIDDVREHLLDKGMDKTYTHWNFHGENNYEVLSEDEDDGELGDIGSGGLDAMLEDLEGGATSHVNPQRDASSNDDPRESGPYGLLFRDTKLPLYPKCEKFSKLEFLVKLLHLKTINLWSNKSFNTILQLIKRALPAGETLPNSYYEAKKYMRDIGLGYIPIHACKNDCMLFWKETEKEQKCLICSEPRYKIDEGKGKKIPHKVLRYFPLIPRLQRLYASQKTAEDMIWHEKKRPREEDVYRHPADAQAWKDFDSEHKWFADEPRNVRLGLASDGFNPFGDMNNAYSMWPVMVMPYNLPPWKCMKQPFLFMSLLIPGPKAPGNDIDVYLRPLVDELKELWEVGVETYDVAKNETFRMHASLLWTINDFPAYGNLSGWSTKGYMACPVCNKDTGSQRLTHGKKICYMCHRRFLPRSHGWRNRKKNLFDGTTESRVAPKFLSGDDVLAQLELIEPVTFGKDPSNKKRKRSKVELNWTKRSIFFELPYWKTLNLRHNLDVMHIEKNICDNVIGTLMSIEGKTKDSAKARLDLQELNIRNELHLTQSGDKFIIPPACYTLSTDERKSWCEWFKSVKFPDGYASNISRCVNVKEGKITGLKSHDSHVLLQRLLPVVIRGYLNDFVSTTLIELGIFFRELCAKKLKLQVLESLERDIAIILYMAPGRRHITRSTQSAQSEPILPAMSHDTSPLSSSVASTSTRKGRGRSKNMALQKALSANGGQRIKIIIPPGLKEPVGKWDKMFKAEVGIIVKMNPPVTVGSGDEVPEHVVSAWHTHIQRSFDIDLLDPHTEKSVNSYCMKRFKSFRYELHKHYKETENPRSHPPAGVSSEDWQLCCTRFESDEFKALSVQNSASRAQLTVSHRCGSKSFAQYRHELTEAQAQALTESQGQVSESQSPISLIVFYKKSHYNEKTDQWSCSQAKTNHEAMERIRAEPTPEGFNPPTDEEIYERVLGRRPGYFRGLGHGVEPISSRSSFHLPCEARVREANERADQALREAAETRAALELSLQEQQQTRAALEVSLQEQQQQNAEVRAMMELLRGQRGLSS